MTGFVDHAGDGISWRERPGAGLVLVALHGIGSEATSFDSLAGHLPGWRVIAWNAPGYGGSAPLAADWPVAADYAAVLGDLVEGLGLRRFHLLGHSLGTLIAASYALAKPDTLLGLTLASCAQGGGATPRTDLPPAQALRLTELHRDGAQAFAAARAPRLIHAPEANPALVAAVAASMAMVRLPGYGQAVRILASGDLVADCARLTVPTAVVVGEGDIVTLPEQSARAHAAIPPALRLGFTQVPGAGHAIHLQAPQALARVLGAQAQPITPPHQQKEQT